MSRRAVARLVALVVGLGVVPLLAASGNATQGPNTFTSADLSTYQTNGIVWTMAQADGLVFVGGNFSAIRPPGAAPGTSETPRTNFAVFNAATGAPTSCHLRFELPSSPVNATVRALNVSPDKKTLYVGGFFSSINGVVAQHIAAIDIASCGVVEGFDPAPNGTVRAIASTSDAVFLGGSMTAVAGQTRHRAAAVRAVGKATQATLAMTNPGHPGRRSMRCSDA